MHQYIIDTKYATRGLIELFFREENKVEKANNTLIEFKEYARKGFSEFQKVLSSELLFEVAEYELAKFEKNISELCQSINNHTIAINSLASALLQIVKQGIFFVYSGLSCCPSGRIIGSETLKNIVWQARNQSIHYEEGSYI